MKHLTFKITYFLWLAGKKEKKNTSKKNETERLDMSLMFCILFISPLYRVYVAVWQQGGYRNHLCEQSPGAAPCQITSSSSQLQNTTSKSKRTLNQKLNNIYSLHETGQSNVEYLQWDIYLLLWISSEISGWILRYRTFL